MEYLRWTRRLAILSVAVGMLGLVSTAETTVIRALTVADKARFATTVAHVRIRRVESLLAEGGTMVLTKIHAEVLRGMKGTDENVTLVITQPGGNVEGFKHRVPGVSKWHVGEEAIVFVQSNSFGELVEIGIGSGKYTIDRTTGTPIARRDRDVAELDPRGILTHKGIPEVTPLDTFLRTIEKALRLPPREAPARGNK